MRRLPPLNPLRAFEASGRWLSFTKAAAELSVTPAALSHQVKSLEAYLGVPLFHRSNNSLALTDAGARYLPLLTEGFDKLDLAGQVLTGPGAARTVTIQALTSVATKWLAPRLGRFYRQYPAFDVRIDATDREVDFRRGNADLAIYYGPELGGELVSEALFTDHVFPVCAPALARGRGGLRVPADLAGVPLLHIDWDPKYASSPDWSVWLQAAGATEVSSLSGARFTLSTMAIEAAIDGQGAALGQRLFASDDLAAGRLVKPFDLELPLPFPYRLALPRRRQNDPAIQALRDWIKSEVAA